MCDEYTIGIDNPANAKDALETDPDVSFQGDIELVEMMRKYSIYSR